MNYLSEPKEGWVIPVSIDLSEAEKQFFDSEMRTMLEKLAPDQPLPDINATSVRGEWQGSGASLLSTPTTKEEFAHFLGTMKDSPVILCLHGGGYITGSAAMERTATFRLCRASDARVFAVDYRLAPQHPFPAALLDALVAYKYLVDPPSDALHEKIDSRRIVIAGDSCGVFSILLRY